MKRLGFRKLWGYNVFSISRCLNVFTDKRFKQTINQTTGIEKTHKVWTTNLTPIFIFDLTEKILPGKCFIETISHRKTNIK